MFDHMQKCFSYLLGALFVTFGAAAAPLPSMVNQPVQEPEITVLSAQTKHKPKHWPPGFKRPIIPPQPVPEPPIPVPIDPPLPPAPPKDPPIVEPVPLPKPYPLPKPKPIPCPEYMTPSERVDGLTYYPYPPCECQYVMAEDENIVQRYCKLPVETM